MAKNEVATQNSGAAATYSTGLDKQIGAFLPMIEKQFMAEGEQFSEYARYCVVAAMGEIISMTHNAGIEPKDISGNNLNDILISVARLQLNANAVPRECYFQIRSVNVAAKNQPAKWEKQIEFNIEGDGYDSLVARYGRGVKKVHPFWAIREGDTYIPPKHRGVEVTPPEWEESGQGKVVRIVYPIEYTDGHIEYHSAERADVAKNLAAHINQNMMNETFGIVTGTKKNDYGKTVPRTRFDATPEEQAKIDIEKRKIMDKVKELGTVEAILDCEELKPFISPSYSEFQSQESMIIRKMRNNIMKKIPKDFGSSAVAHTYNMIDDGIYREVQVEIAENANSISFEEVPQIEKKPPMPTIPKQTAEKEPVEAAEGKQTELPDFMKAE